MRGLGWWGEVIVIQIAVMMGSTVVAAHPFSGFGALGSLGVLSTRSPGLRGLRVLGTLGAFLSLSVASPFRGWGPGEGHGNAGAR